MATATNTMPASPQAQVQAQARNDIENRRRDAEDRARQSIDRDAVAAIEETQQALRAIADGRTDEAIQAIERATGKIDILTSRNPATALLPVDTAVVVLDTAPTDLDAVRDLATAAEGAVFVRDFPLARVVLGALVSEIRVRTIHLPLATYPAALREAAHLLDEHRNDDARALLGTAMSTLVVIDQVIPLPLVLAQIAVGAAEAVRDSDRDAAVGLLTVARHELDRCMELGYMGRDEEYKNLSRAISDLERQVRGSENTTSAFAKLRDRLASFFRRMSDTDRSSARNGNGRTSATANRQPGGTSAQQQPDASAASMPGQRP